MKMKTCEDILHSFGDYFSGQFMVGQTDYGCMVMTPFLKADNDTINIYVQDMGGGKVKITDYGDCLFDLERLGYEFNTDRKKGILEEIVRKVDVAVEDKALVIITDIESSPDAIQRVLNAATEICSLHYQTRGIELNDFSKEVSDYLFDKGIEHSYHVGGVHVNYEGMSFSFSMTKPSSRADNLGALIQTMRIEDKSQSSNVSKRKVFNFLYLKSERAKFTGISVIDTKEGLWSENSIKLIRHASHHVFEWEEREAFLEYMRSGDI